MPIVGGRATEQNRAREIMKNYLRNRDNIKFQKIKDAIEMQRERARSGVADIEMIVAADEIIDEQEREG